MLQFQRQINLKELGELGQKNLMESQVLIVGLGGLGHPLVQYLEAMGVGTIGLMDGDVVSLSNIHRQVLFSKKDVQQYKVDVIANYFLVRDSSTRLIKYKEYLTKSLALDLFPQFDLIIDGTDNFETKFLINDVCLLLKKPFVFGSVSSFEGSVGSFLPDQGGCYRCFMNHIPKSKIKNCVEEGVIGVLPGIIGSVEALKAFKILQFLKGNRHFSDQKNGVDFFDFKGSYYRSFEIPKAPSCLCRKVDFSPNDVVESEVRACPYSDRDRFLLDVREEDEVVSHPSFGVENWPLSRIQRNDFPRHLKDKRIMALCVSGSRAKEACRLMKAEGFSITYSSECVYELKI